MSKRKRNLIIAIFLTVLSIIYTLCVKFIDVKKIGPNNSNVGFSTINNCFKKMIGSNMNLYKLTEILGYIAILIACTYALIGLIQFIKRKSIFKVDKEIILLGFFYAIVVLIYIFFEKCIINYRPIIIDNELEASFPSSHTLLALCICTSSIIISKKYINKKYIKFTNIATILLMLGVLFGRLFSGVHWLIDIIGGIIISITLITYFIYAYGFIRKH